MVRFVTKLIGCAVLTSACSGAMEGELEGDGQAGEALPPQDGASENGSRADAASAAEGGATARVASAADHPQRSEAEFQQAILEPLSAEHKRAIIAAFAQNGVHVDDEQFVGRMLRVEDSFLNVDAMIEQLQADREVEKGRVFAQTLPFYGPSEYVEQDGGNFFFSRPEMPRPNAGDHWLVLDDSAPAFLETEFTQAISDIANAAADDCLQPGFLQVHRQSDLDALDPIGRSLLRIYRVVFDVLATACPNFPAGFSGGCGNLPQARNVVLTPPTPGGGGATQRRMTFGERIGVTSDVPAGNVALYTHELLHTLGIAHPREEVFPGTLVTTAKFFVPGTNTNFSGFQSIMHSPILVDQFNVPILTPGGSTIANPDFSATLAADDIDVIRTLYHNGNAPADCGYSLTDTLIPPR